MRKKNMDMSPTEIRVEMLRHDVNQAAIARQVGVSKTTVMRVIDNLTVSKKVREAIAEAIGIPLERIWPSTYLHGGPRKPGRPAKEFRRRN